MDKEALKKELKRRIKALSKYKHIEGFEEERRLLKLQLWELD